jgi:hypothetical protein
MKLTSLLSEAMLFKDFDDVKIDPDRDDTTDLANKLLPAIIKMAYKNLYSDREKHERKYGAASDEEDAYNFDFTSSALEDEVDDVISHFVDRLKGLNMTDLKDAIDKSASHFPVPLEKKKK